VDVSRHNHSGRRAARNLDYSFVAGQEDGTFEYPATQPGGGNRGFRQQLRVLREFLESFDFVRMKPDAAVVKTKLGKHVHCYALVEPVKQYAIYLSDMGAINEFALDLPAGTYRAEWIYLLDGRLEIKENVKSTGGVTMISAPQADADFALRIKRLEK
jgi:hypothetical protein